MEQIEPRQYDLDSFTSKEWSGKPVQDGCAILVAAIVFSFVLCVVLAGIAPGIGSFGLGLLFFIVFVILTLVGMIGRSSAERTFLNKMTAKINKTIRELTGQANDHFTAESFRKFVQKGQFTPLPVDGVPGIELRVVREPAVNVTAPAAEDKQMEHLLEQIRTGKDRQGKQPKPVDVTRLILAITPLDYGTGSFDRLLSATLDDIRSE